jgi:glycosyltransferase involved in cell wall biosynthesis
VGPDEERLGDQILELSANNRNHVRVIGFSSEPYQYLAAADVLCLPSYREGFGTVIIEAAAMSIPAIGSNIYGIRDAIQDKETGLLHRVGYISDIKKSMETLLKDRHLLDNLRQKAKLRAINEFDAKLLTNLWLKFYKEHL